MAIRNDGFKGATDFANGEILYDYDLDDTNDAIINLAARGQAELAYRTLQSNNVFTNGDHFVTDEFTDTTGSQNTVNTGSTTAVFAGNNYQLDLTEVHNSSSNTLTNTGTNSFTYNSTANTINIAATGTGTSGVATREEEMDISNLSSGERMVFNSTITLVDVSSASSASANLKITDGSTPITLHSLSSSAAADAGTTVETKYFEIIHNGSNVLVYEDGTLVQTLATTYADRLIYYTTTNNASASASSATIDSANFFIGTVSASAVITCDTGTKSLDGTEESIVVYADYTAETSNATITCDISDGTTTLSAQSLNTVVGLNSFTSGTLDITFNLATSNSGDTIKVRGYGVYII